MKIVLIRHGEAEGAVGRAIGHTDLPLSTAGRAAVATLADRWLGPPPTAIHCSDLARAAESARILAEHVGGPAPLADSRLRELSLGDIDGGRWDDPRLAEAPGVRAWLEDWTTLAPPGGETLLQVHERLAAFRAALPGAGTLVIVSHATPIRLWLADLLGWPWSRLFDLELPTASASGLRRRSAGFEVSFSGQREPDFRTFLTDAIE